MSATARRLVSVRHHAVTLAPTPGLTAGTQLGLFLDVAPAPPPRPVGHYIPRAKVPRGQAQRVLHLTVLPDEITDDPTDPDDPHLDKDGMYDAHEMTRGACLSQRAGCPATLCRHHLTGGTKVLRGRRLGCSLAAAEIFGALPPQDVAHLEGYTDSEVQRVEHEAVGRLRLECGDDEDLIEALVDAGILPDD